LAVEKIRGFNRELLLVDLPLKDPAAGVTNCFNLASPQAVDLVGIVDMRRVSAEHGIRSSDDLRKAFDIVGLEP
jgi:hypothetical protein